MSKGKKLGIWITIFLICIICILLILLKLNQTLTKEDIPNNIVSEEIQERKQKDKVKEANTFYTVKNCIERYLGYVAQKDIESLMQVLDKSYTQKEQITSTNIEEKINDLGVSKIYTAKTMYQEKNDGNIKTYYVSGTVRDDIMDMQTEEKPFYVTVKLDTVNQTFSIMPEGYMFSVKTEKESENELCYIAIHQVDTYYNKSEIDITIKNKTNQPLELSNFSLEYYEEGLIQSLGDNTVLTVEGNVSKGFKLVFENKVNTPHKLNYKIKGQEYSIEIVKNTDIE